MKDRQQAFDKCSPEHVQAVIVILEEVARPKRHQRKGPRDDDFGWRL